VRDDERLRIEGKATELQARLDRVPQDANVRTFPLSVAS